MEWYLNLDNLNALNEWGVDSTDCILVNLVQKYQDPARAPGLLRTDRGGVWINHAYLLEQVPSLKIKVDTLGRRLKKLADIGILEREIVYPLTENGVRKNACYRVSESFVEMCQYFKAVQDLHSDKKLSEKDRQGKLAFLIKEKPEVSRTVFESGTGKTPERDERGRFRTVFESGTQRDLNPVHNGNEIPYIPPLDPLSRNSGSKVTDHLPLPAGQPTGPGMAKAPEPEAGVQEGGEEVGKEEGLRHRIAGIKDLRERCKAKMHYREQGFDV